MLVNYSVMSENEVETVFVRSFKELKILLPASVLEFKFVRLFTEFRPVNFARIFLILHSEHLPVRLVHYEQLKLSSDRDFGTQVSFSISESELH